METKISPISFGSIYNFDFKINTVQNNFDQHWELQNYCNKNDYEYITKFYSSNKLSKDESNIDEAQSFATVPDEKDVTFEAFCKQKNIDFIKYPSVDSKKILSKIDSKQGGIWLIDANLFEHSIPIYNLKNYLNCKKNYELVYKPAFSKLLDNETKLEPPVLFFNYKDNLKDSPKNQIIEAMFDESGEVPAYCIYFALKDSGINEIPVKLDENSARLANDWGLIHQSV